MRRVWRSVRDKLAVRAFLRYERALHRIEWRIKAADARLRELGYARDETARHMLDIQRGVDEC